MHHVEYRSNSHFELSKVDEKNSARNIPSVSLLLVSPLRPDAGGETHNSRNKKDPSDPVRPSYFIIVSYDSTSLFR